MAVVMAKKFLRTMAQPFDHNQIGISMWDANMVKEAVRKDRLKRRMVVDANEGGGAMEMETGVE